MRLDESQTSWNVSDAFMHPLTRSLTYHREKGQRLTLATFKTPSSGIKSGKITAENPIPQSAMWRKFLLLAYSVEPEDLYGEQIAALRTQQTAAGNMLVVGNTDYNRPRWMGATRTEFYLDPKRSFLPVRHVLMLADGQIVQDTSIEYTEHETLGFAPVQLKSIRYKKAEPSVIEFTWNFTFAVCSVNTSIPQEYFEIEFPVGTSVTDEIVDIQYKVGEIHAVGQADHWVEDVLAETSPRELGAGDFRLPAMEERAQTDAAMPSDGEDGNVPRTDQLWLFALALGVFAVFLVGGRTWWRKARRVLD